MRQKYFIGGAYVLAIAAIVISLWRCEPFELDAVAILANILTLMVTILLGIIAYNYFIQKEDSEKFKTKVNKLIDEERAERNKQIVTLKEHINNLGKYVDNPEWVWVVVDASNHILFGIRRDGSIDWSIGVPGPIKKELDEIKQRLKELENPEKK